MTEQNTLKKLVHKASSSRKLYVFLFCLLLATFFWLLNALSNHFTTNIDFNLKYANPPENKIVLNELPDNINIKIKGLGFDLLAYKLRLRKPTVTIDLSKFKGIDSKTISSYSLASTSYSSYIDNQIGDNIEVRDIYPDSIYFVFDQKTEKTLKIIPVTRLSFKKQFKQFGKAIIKPAIVKVSGPSSFIDTMQSVYTDSIVFTDVAETITETIGFNSSYSSNKITIKPDRALLHLPVEKFTETSVTVKIDYINVPDSIVMKAIPSETEVTFLLPLSKMASLASAQFSAQVDYFETNDNFNHKLKVNLTEYPDYIQVQNLNPTKVEYILKYK